MIKTYKLAHSSSITDSFLHRQRPKGLKGAKIIKYYSKNLPSKPGVYQMESKTGEILYIGKAKNLSKRVLNYTLLSNLSRRIQRMVNLTMQINFFVTNTEIEALLLECNLIKKHKPRFNIILRDDKSFPYVFINKDYKYPRILKYRGPKKNKGDYYGPFVSPSVADYTLISLQKIFLLRSCPDTIFKNRTRPCLLYDIKRCSAPCVKKISEKKYNENIKDAKKFLNGNTKKMKIKLQNLMNDASKKQMYEDAAKLRDRIKSIDQIQKYQSVYIKDMRNIDIFAIKIFEGRSCIYGMFYRNGSNYGNKSFFPTHDTNVSEYEILESFFYQFYSDKEVPPKILINLNDKFFQNVALILSKKNNKKINIIKPRAGEKYKHILLAEKNVNENIKLKNIRLENHHNALEKLKEFLSLEQLPNRIEVYDNSHTFGKQPVGVMVVVDQEGFNSKHYRKFNIRFNETSKNTSQIDDYYMMKEVLLRRLKKINKNSDTILPDVIILDGGKGQLNIAKKIISENNLTSITIMSISKGKKRNAGREIIHTLKESKILKPNDTLLFFLQRIRDEAHRFAIKAHRNKRKKHAIRSVFDEIQGIGPKRKKILMSHFSTINNLKNASFDELMEIKSIPKDLIEKIYGFFHSQ